MTKLKLRQISYILDNNAKIGDDKVIVMNGKTYREVDNQRQLHYSGNEEEKWRCKKINKKN